VIGLLTFSLPWGVGSLSHWHAMSMQCLSVIHTHKHPMGACGSLFKKTVNYTPIDFRGISVSNHRAHKRSIDEQILHNVCERKKLRDAPWYKSKSQIRVKFNPDLNGWVWGGPWLMGLICMQNVIFCILFFIFLLYKTRCKSECFFFGWGFYPDIPILSRYLLTACEFYP